MNNPVKYELAKLLKEKGYSELCESYYHARDLEPIETSTKCSNKTITKSCCTAPTIAEVVMWLYEKHGIWTTTEPLGEKKNYPRWSYKVIHLNNPNSNIEWELKQLTISYKELIKNSFKSPTEAYEAAIEYCLTKLI